MTSISSPSFDVVRTEVLQLLDSIDLDGPIVATAAFRVKQDKRDEFGQSAARLTEAMRRAPGIKMFSYDMTAPDPDSNVEYVFYQEWQNADRFRAHWNSAPLREFQKETARWITAAPKVTLLRPCEPTLRSGILRTGATKCWDTEGLEVECEGTGQDAAVEAGVPVPDPRFTDNGDGTVTDHLSGLIWLKNADAFGEVTWDEAVAKARALHAGDYDLNDGSVLGDWRLSNIRELLSLIDYGSSDPILPPDYPFESVKSAIYWTSTTLTPAPLLAWMITLGIGPTVFVVKKSPAHMWPVRGGGRRVLQTGQRQCWDSDGKEIPAAGTGQDGDLQCGVPLPLKRFTDNKNGTVTDELTGLVWLKNANPFGFKTWAHALACCQAVADGSFGLTDDSSRGDWRLPNIREIESLVDYGRAGPCLPEGHPFDDVRPSSYWTSTTVAAGPTEAMFIILGVGPSIFENKEHQFFVWPVRSKVGRK